MKWFIKRILRRMIDEHMKKAQNIIATIQHDRILADDPLWFNVHWEQRYAHRIRKILNKQ